MKYIELFAKNVFEITTIAIVISIMLLTLSLLGTIMLYGIGAVGDWIL